MARVVAVIRAGFTRVDDSQQRSMIERRLEQAIIRTEHGIVQEVQTWISTSDVKTTISNLSGVDVVLLHSLDVVDTDSFGGAATLLRPIDEGISLVDCRSKTVYTKELESVMMLTMICLSGEITRSRDRERELKIAGPLTQVTDERERA